MSVKKHGRGRPKGSKNQSKTIVPIVFEKSSPKKAYKRIKEIIIELVEKAVMDMDDDGDPLWNELAQVRKIVIEQGTIDQQKAVSCLMYSLHIGPVATELDEATTPSHSTWR